jgi:phosphoenolpyruvate carboxylase
MTDKKLLEKLDEKLDLVETRLSSIDVTLAKQELNLQEHMRRSLLNEEAIDLIKEELKPVQKHVTQVHTILQVVGFVAVLVSIVASVVKVLEFVL